MKFKKIINDFFLPINNISKIEEEYREYCLFSNNENIIHIYNLLGITKGNKYLDYIKIIRNKFINNQYNIIDKLFIKSCQAENLSQIKFLLENKELNYQVDKNKLNNGLRWAANNIDIVIYFFSNKNYEPFLDIHFSKDFLFRFACHNMDKNTLEYLIIEKDIQITEDIENYLIEHPSDLAEHIFQKKLLNKKLNIDLISKESLKTKLIKI